MKKFVVALLLVALSAAAREKPTNEDISARIRARVDAKKNSGIVAAVIDSRGNVSMAGYGDAGPGALPLDADSVFEIGSISKVFTATLLADMVDRGEVRLDDPVEKFLPPGTTVPERNGRKITLGDLSTQSSGLPRLPDNLHPADPSDPYADYTVAQLYDFLARYELTRDPGTQYEYSNLGVGLLGHALALRAGKTYEELVRDRIFRPLRMEHSGITLTPWMQRHLAKGHDAEGNVVPNWNIPTLAGAGALRSTMSDMLRFARANLQPRAGAIQHAMQVTHRERMATDRPDLAIGLGWHIRKKGAQEIHWHNGGTGGYRTWIGFDAKRGLAAIVLTNSSQGADDLGYELLE
jgi:CubicO group peptidase (beta-lactamase class C family)